MRNICLVMLLMVISTFEISAQYEIGFSNNYPPYNYKNSNGNLVGFNVDLLNAVLDLYNTDIDIRGESWEVLVQSLEDGDIHAVAGAHYAGRPDDNYIYTRSTINTSHSFFYSRKKSKMFSLEWFRTIKEPLVVLWNNDVLIRYVHSINPTARFNFVDNYEDLIYALEQEDVVCAFSQRLRTKYHALVLGKTNIRYLDHQVMERNMGFKVSKDFPELATMLNNGLEVILANGEYERIYNKWLKEYDQSNVEWKKYIKYFSISGTIILLLLFSLIVFNRILHSRVRSKTKDLQLQLDLNSEIMLELEMQKTRAEESDRMKSAFLANMSHEIRTPMNGILGFTELLKSMEYSAEEQIQFIDIIQGSGQRMLETINNIIDVSKLESGLEKPKYAEVDIESILGQLQEFFKPETLAKGLEIIIKGETLEPVNGFYSDSYMLNSIFTNLIKNAIKFTFEGFIEIDYRINSDEAKFCVKDTGIGIDPDKLETIFNQFVQADVTDSKRFEGSGLGLSITKGYVNLLNGKIKIESELQKGTTFYIIIPNKKSKG